MTTKEQERQEKLISLVKSYEATEVESEQKNMLAQINEFSECSEYDIQNYWRATSIEEFCASLAVEPEANEEMSREKAISIITEMKSLGPSEFRKSDYLLEKYETSIEIFFNCGSYSLRDAIGQTNKSVAEIVKEIEGNGPIQL